MHKRIGGTELTGVRTLNRRDGALRPSERFRLPLPSLPLRLLPLPLGKVKDKSATRRGRGEGHGRGKGGEEGRKAASSRALRASARFDTALYGGVQMDQASRDILRGYWELRGEKARRKAWLEVEARDGSKDARRELARMRMEARRGDS